MTTNKNHWYDGWLYDRFIAPNQDTMFRHIKALLPAGARVLDVGCGTGRLAFALAGTCSAVMGIDLSRRNIEQAQRRLSQTPRSGVSFRHASVREILSEGREHFEYAVLTYVLHEMDEEERVPLLVETLRLADRVVIGDYLVPVSGGLKSVMDDVVERAAGKEHHRNFRSYVKSGGIRGLVSGTPVELVREFRYAAQGRHIAVVGMRA